MKQVRFISIMFLLVLCSACIFRKGHDHKRYTKEDFLLYRKGPPTANGKIRTDGVYRGFSGNFTGFTRFFADGRVVQGSCKDFDLTQDPNQCFDNPDKVSLYGYYWLRNDTVFMEWDDNVPISAGIQISLCKIRNDSLIGLYGFDRDKLKDKKNLLLLPRPGDKDVLVYSAASSFYPVNLANTIKPNW